MAYQVVVDGQVVTTYGENEYVEALEDAAHLDFMANSPELNDGIENHIKVELYYNGQPIINSTSP